MAKKITITAAVWLLISTLCILIFYGDYVIEYSRIDAAVFFNGEKIVVNDDEVDITIMRLKDGRYADRMVSYSKIEDSCFNVCRRLIQENGRLYILNSKYETGQNQKHHQILEVNFDGKTLETVHEFDENGLKTAFMSYIKGENEYSHKTDYFYSGGMIDGKPYAVICDYDGDERCGIYRAVYNADTDSYFIDHSASAADNLLDIFSTEQGFYVLYKNCAVGFTDEESEKMIANPSTVKTIWRTHGEADSFFAADVASQSIKLISEGKMSVYSTLFDALLKENGILVNDINFIYKNDGSELLAAYYDGDRAGLIDFDGENITVSNNVFRYSPKRFISVCVLTVPICAAVAVMLLLFIRFLVKKGSVMLKIVCAALPAAFIFSMAAYFIIGNILAQRSIDFVYNSMIEYVKQTELLSAAYKVNDYNDYLNPENENYKKTAAAAYMLNNLPYVNVNSGSIADRYDNVNKNKNYFDYELFFFGFDKENGRFVGPVNYFMDAAAEDYCESYYSGAMYEAAEKRVPLQYVRYDKDNVCMNCIAVPVFDDEGNVYGAYTIGLSASEMISDVSPILGKIIYSMIFFFFLIVVIFCIITAVSIRMLKKLRIQAERLTGGQSGCYVDIKEGRADEICEIAEHFNEMSKNVDHHLKKIEGLRNGYRGFFSDDLLNVLGKKSVALLTLSENTERELYIARFFISEKTDKERFKSFSDELLGSITEVKGFVTRINSVQAAAMSTSGSLFAAALSVCEKYREVKMVFDKTVVRLRFTGEDDRYMIDIQPVNRKREFELDKCLADIGASFLVTHNAFPSDGNKIRARYVAICENEKVYELLAHNVDSRYNVTRKLFEDGVNNFYTGRTETARRNFVKILKINPADEAARYYIKLLSKDGETE